MWNTLFDGEIRGELAMVRKLPATLAELPSELRLAEGSWQHAIVTAAAEGAGGNGGSSATGAGPASVDAAGSTLVARGAEARAERGACRALRKSGTRLCFLGTGAMKPSTHRNVSAALLQLPAPPSSWCISQQIEFYFSPGNLERDTFLQGQIALSSARWVELSVRPRTVLPSPNPSRRRCAPRPVPRRMICHQRSRIYRAALL